MVASTPIAVLWDDSHIWGLMLLRALSSYGYPIRILKGCEIAQGALFRKQGPGRAPRFDLLAVPGGAASLKAAALGTGGIQQVRDFVAAGGRYLGFCGGAGTALSHSKGLGLCPWKRAKYPDRLLHLLSGHVLASPCAHRLTPDWEGRTPSIPVWWPGLFGNSGGNVDILARYSEPDRDFWIADIPVGSLSPEVLADWQRLFGVDLTGAFLSGSELIVRGGYGHGEYVLSYAHLETPASPDANVWLAHLLERLTGAAPERTLVPDWILTEQARAHLPCAAPISRSAARLRALTDLAIEKQLFFRRTSWLTGWKPATPGSAFCNLTAALGEAEAAVPGPLASGYWREAESEFVRLEEAFFPAAERYIQAARLSETLLATLPSAVARAALTAERDRLFGHPMHGGGLLGRMLQLIEEYLFCCLRQDEREEKR